VVNGAIGRTNLPRKAENQEEEEEDLIQPHNTSYPVVLYCIFVYFSNMDDRTHPFTMCDEHMHK